MSCFPFQEPPKPVTKTVAIELKVEESVPISYNVAHFQNVEVRKVS